jgi:hypothetical protein
VTVLEEITPDETSQGFPVQATVEFMEQPRLAEARLLNDSSNLPSAR